MIYTEVKKNANELSYWKDPSDINSDAVIPIKLKIWNYVDIDDYNQITKQEALRDSKKLQNISPDKVPFCKSMYHCLH